MIQESRETAKQKQRAQEKTYNTINPNNNKTALNWLTLWHSVRKRGGLIHPITSRTQLGTAQLTMDFLQMPSNQSSQRFP